MTRDVVHRTRSVMPWLAPRSRKGFVPQLKKSGAMIAANFLVAPVPFFQKLTRFFKLGWHDYGFSSLPDSTPPPLENRGLLLTSILSV